jgi:L-lactate dehydrogenase (cytochrome)
MAAQASIQDPGPAHIYALAASGQTGVAHLLALIAEEIRVAMTLTGARTVKEIDPDSLVREGELRRGANGAELRPGVRAAA